MEKKFTEIENQAITLMLKFVMENSIEVDGLDHKKILAMHEDIKRKLDDLTVWEIVDEDVPDQFGREELVEPGDLEPADFSGPNDPHGFDR